MSFSSTSVIGNALSNDYIHDFSSGTFTLPFDLILGMEGSAVIGGFSGAGAAGTIFTTDTWQPSTSGTSSAGLVSNPTSGYATAVYSIGSVASQALISVGGQNFSRANVISAGGYGTYGGNIRGPYTVAYDTAGAKSVTIYLYFRQGNINQWGPGGSIPAPTSVPQVYSSANKSFAFNLYQQAVAITNRNSNTGPSLTDGLTISDMDTFTNNVIILNKANNRGDDTTSTWLVYKQDSLGVYNAASVGSDYTLGFGEVITDDQITLTWTSPGNYRVINSAVGLSSVSSGVNYDLTTTNFIVGQNTIDTITLPLVEALMTPISAYDNTVVTTDPLVGISTFGFTVEGIVDVATAEWTQQIGPTTTVLTMSEAAWTTELTSRCNIKCKVYQGTTLVATRTGFGPHTFYLGEGSYTAGFEVTPKAATVVALADTIVR